MTALAALLTLAYPSDACSAIKIGLVAYLPDPTPQCECLVFEYATHADEDECYSHSALSARVTTPVYE